MDPKLDATQAANPANDNTQRQADGKFAKGNLGGPGNPFTRKTAFLRTIALETTTEQDIREIFAALKVKALAGDLAATKIFLSYTIGKPQPAVDPDTINKHEVETMLANTTTDPQLVTNLLQSMSLDLILPMLRFLISAALDTNRERAFEELTKPIVPPAPPPHPGDADLGRQSRQCAVKRAWLAARSCREPQGITGCCQ